MTFEVLKEVGYFGNMLLEKYKYTTENGDLAFSIPLKWVLLVSLACAAIGYFIGSLNFGVIISRAYGRDIREVGSGNAGATNMMRVYGKKASILTLLCDVLKTILAVCIARFLIFGYQGAYIAGLFVIIGHAWPLYFKFKGGKGVAAIAAFCLVTEPIIFLIELAIFLVILFGFRMVSLGSVMIALIYPFMLNFVTNPQEHSIFTSLYVVISFIMAGLVIFLHRQNLVRIFNHTEHKFKFGKKDRTKKEPVVENAEKEQNEESKE